MKRLTTLAAATLVATCLMATPQSAAASTWGNIINAIWKQWYAVYGDNQVVFVHNNTDRIAMLEVRRGDGTYAKVSTRHFTARVIQPCPSPKSKKACLPHANDSRRTSVAVSAQLQ